MVSIIALLVMRAYRVTGTHRVRFCFARSLQGATLKVELVGRRRYQTRAEARASILAWIAWYNRRRRHSTNGYLSPVEWEHRHAPSTTTVHMGRITRVFGGRGAVHLVDA